jgi:phenylpropionate dioxygenase-like ring-hydroxylating dioxygenase large terminal subunit
VATSLALLPDASAWTASPRALPAWVYKHPEMTRLEMERILRPSWQIVCHVNSIPNPGHFVTLDLGGESVVVLRDRENRIQAFHNVCRHRSARIFDGAGRCAGTITCPYHGWTYSYDGRLIGTPMRETFPGLDRAAHGLKPVRVEIAMGFAFVCLAGDPPPLAEVWAPFAAEFAPYRLEAMIPLGPITEEEWDVDWKVAIDNYLESYHVPVGHPGLARMFTPDYEDQRGEPGIARGTSWVREQPSSRWSERYYQQLVGPTSTHLPEPNRRCWRFYSMLPNLGIDVFPEQIDFFQVLPRGPGKCTIRGAVFGLPDDRREMRVLRMLGARINRQVNAEDHWLCRRVQRGLASSSYTPGPLSRLERWMAEFHQQLRTRIPEASLPAAPTHFA